MSDITSVSETKEERLRSSFTQNLISLCARWLNLAGAAIVVVSLSTMFISILVNVVLRYAFNSGFTWAYELPSILFPWTVAGGLVMASVQGRNIAVDAIVKILPEKIRWLLAIAVNISTSLISAGVVYYAMPIVKASKYSRLAETGIPQIYGYSSIVFTFSVIAFVALLSTVEFLMGRKATVSDPTEANFS